jgi:hypothetical protein
VSIESPIQRALNAIRYSFMRCSNWKSLRHRRSCSAKVSSSNLELNETNTFSKADPCFNNPINSYSQLFIQESNCVELILVSQENAGSTSHNYIVHKVAKTTGSCVQDNCSEVPFGCSNAGNIGNLHADNVSVSICPASISHLRHFILVFEV